MSYIEELVCPFLELTGDRLAEESRVVGDCSFACELRRSD